MIYFSHEEGPLGVVAGGWRAFLEGYAANLAAGRLRFQAGGLVATGSAEPDAAPGRGGIGWF